VALAHSAVENMHRQRSMLCISIAEEATSAVPVDSPEWRVPSQVRTLLAEYFSDRIAEGRLAGETDFLACTFMGMMFQYVVARRLWNSHAIERTTVDRLVDVFLNGVQR
jgi:hypothetical protein